MLFTGDNANYFIKQRKEAGSLKLYSKVSIPKYLSRAFLTQNCMK